MRDIYFIPNSKKKKEITLTILLACASALIFAFSFSGLVSRSVLQLCFLVVMVVDILLIARFFLTNFKYTITDECGDVMLLVTQIQGKRISTLANFKLKDIRKIEIAETEAEKKELIARCRSKQNRYSYIPSLSPEQITCLTLKSDYTVYTVLLQTEKQFSDVLREIVVSISKDEEE